MVDVKRKQTEDIDKMTSKRNIPLPIQAADVVVGGINKVANTARRGFNKIAYPAQVGQQLLGQGIGMAVDAFSGREPLDFKAPEIAIPKTDGLTLPSTKYENQQAAIKRPVPTQEAAPVPASVQTTPEVPETPQQLQQKPNLNLPKGNTLPSQPNVDKRVTDAQIPLFDNKYIKDNYNEGTGYVSDNDPRMIKRRAEAEEVQKRRMQYIADSEAGKFDVSGPGPAISGGVPVKPDGYKPIQIMGKGEREGNARRNSAEQIASARDKTDRQMNEIKRDYYNTRGVKAPKEVTLSDQLDSIKQGKDYGESYTSKIVPGLPTVVGEELYKLAVETKLPITDLETLLDEELIKLQTQGSDEDIARNPEEIVSRLRSRTNYEQSGQSTIPR